MRFINLAYLFLILLLGVADVEARDTLIQRALTHYIQAGVWERLEQLDSAIKEYKAALKSDYNSPHIHLRLAIVLLKQNQLKQTAAELGLAIKYYEVTKDLSAETPCFVEAHTLLALVYSLQGNLEEATLEYEKALQGALALDPQNIRIHKSLARIYLRKSKFSEAENTYRFILSISPSDAESHFYLGTIHEQQGRRNEAIEGFKNALKFNPEYLDALNSLSYLYAEDSINLAEAEAMIKKALIYDPNNGAYIDTAGWVYFKQGRYEEAIQELERAVHFLSDPVIYEHIGDAYLKQGNITKAKENWQESLKINSGENTRVKEKLEDVIKDE